MTTSQDILKEIDPACHKTPDNSETAGTGSRKTGHELAGSSGESLTGARLAIVNTFDNKFNEIYRTCFEKYNEVKVVQPRTVEELTELTKWADIIWSTWCNEAAVHLSQMDNRPPLVTHIRSYEILMPGFMTGVKWDRVDGAIFVADHIREIANEMWPSQLSCTKQVTVNNCVRLPDYPFYENGPGGNIAYVGYLNHKKGIGLLLQCIQAAAELDRSYRWHIAGAFQEQRFEVYMKHLIAEMGLADRVNFCGWVKDVPGFLKEMNYVVSTSPWEGCPNNIIEAMACGVKPLIHNWRGARDLFPEKLVFNTIDQFRILLTETNYDPRGYRNYVENHFNAETNLKKIDSFLAAILEQSGHKTESSGPPVQNSQPSSSLTIQRKSTEQAKTDSINYFQPLAKEMGYVDNRKQFTVDFCRGKRVLHIGCADTGIMQQRIQESNFLHQQISSVAESLVGVDINNEGIAYLSDAGYDVHTVNIETDGELLKELTSDIDVIVMPEVIEHLDNVGAALDNIKACDFDGDILISTPNAFSFRVFQLLAQNIELVHPDHNHYYSVTTLSTLLRKHGFDIKRMLMYYWPTDDELCEQLKRVLPSCPYLAEGIIAIVKG